MLTEENQMKMAADIDSLNQRLAKIESLAETKTAFNIVGKAGEGNVQLKQEMAETVHIWKTRMEESGETSNEVYGILENLSRAIDSSDGLLNLKVEEKTKPTSSVVVLNKASEVFDSANNEKEKQKLASKCGKLHLEDSPSSQTGEQEVATSSDDDGIIENHADSRGECHCLTSDDDQLYPKVVDVVVREEQKRSPKEVSLQSTQCRVPGLKNLANAERMAEKPSGRKSALHTDCRVESAKRGEGNDVVRPFVQDSLKPVVIGESSHNRMQSNSIIKLTELEGIKPFNISRQSRIREYAFQSNSDGISKEPTSSETQKDGLCRRAAIQEGNDKRKSTPENHLHKSLVVIRPAEERLQINGNTRSNKDAKRETVKMPRNPNELESTSSKSDRGELRNLSKNEKGKSESFKEAVPKESDQHKRSSDDKYSKSLNTSQPTQKHMQPNAETKSREERKNQQFIIPKKQNKPESESNENGKEQRMHRNREDCRKEERRDAAAHVERPRHRSRSPVSATPSSKRSDETKSRNEANRCKGDGEPMPKITKTRDSRLDANREEEYKNIRKNREEKRSEDREGSQKGKKVEDAAARSEIPTNRYFAPSSVSRSIKRCEQTKPGRESSHGEPMPKMIKPEDSQFKEEKHNEAKSRKDEPRLDSAERKEKPEKFESTSYVKSEEFKKFHNKDSKNEKERQAATRGEKPQNFHRLPVSAAQSSERYEQPKSRMESNQSMKCDEPMLKKKLLETEGAVETKKIRTVESREEPGNSSHPPVPASKLSKFREMAIIGMGWNKEVKEVNFKIPRKVKDQESPSNAASNGDKGPNPLSNLESHKSPKNKQQDAEERDPRNLQSSSRTIQSNTPAKSHRGRAEPEIMDETFESSNCGGSVSKKARTQSLDRGQIPHSRARPTEERKPNPRDDETETDADDIQVGNYGRDFVSVYLDPIELEKKEILMKKMSSQELRNFVDKNPDCYTRAEKLFQGFVEKEFPERSVAPFCDVSEREGTWREWFDWLTKEKRSKRMKESSDSKKLSHDTERDLKKKAVDHSRNLERGTTSQNSGVRHQQIEMAPSRVQNEVANNVFKYDFKIPDPKPRKRPNR